MLHKIFVFLLIAVSAFTSTAFAQQTDQHPNLLVIMVDDVAQSNLSAYSRALKVASNARVYEALPPLAFLAFLRSANIRATDT